MNKSITCIIPFYNEGKQIISVIEKVLEVIEINQVICVDDGSPDSISTLISKKFTRVTLKRFDINQGKAAAVFEGLKLATNEDVLLMDADWLNLKVEEIRQALSKYNNSTLDMLILKNTGSNSWIDEKLRKYVFLSGNRIMKKRDLEEVQKLKPKGYQLEVAINKYMNLHNKKVAWIQTSAFNPHKVKKLGLINGLIKDLKMELDIFSYIGIIPYFKQMFTFCREELK